MNYIINQKIEPVEKERLLNRWERTLRLGNIPEKRYWLNLSELNPETKATVFWTRWNTSSKTEQKELLKTLVKIPGMTSDRFLGQLEKLSQSTRNK